MKKLVSCVVLIAMLPVVFVSCFDLDKQADKTTNEKEEKPARMNISKNPEAFNTAFDSLMQSYYRVKNALINWDSLAAGNEAKSLAQLSEQLPVNTLQADSSLVLTAHSFTDAISSKSNKLATETTIEAKRRAFSELSDQLYSLINSVRYDHDVIYYDMCPMAFGDNEQAYWLSADSTISNPYLGNKHPKYHSAMLNCGDVEQEINFAAKP